MVAKLKVASVDTASKDAAALYFENMTNLLTSSRKDSLHLGTAHCVLVAQASMITLSALVLAALPKVS